MILKTLVPICMLLFICSSCSSPEGYDANKIQKASLERSTINEFTQIIHFDYDKNEKRLVRKFEKVKISDADELEIAISNFLTKTQFRGNYRQLNYNYSNLKSESSIFYFSGSYDFDRIDDEEIFKKALELTITNYTNSANIDLVFNDNKF